MHLLWRLLFYSLIEINLCNSQSQLCMKYCFILKWKNQFQAFCKSHWGQWGITRHGMNGIPSWMATQGLMSEMARCINTNQLSFQTSVINELNLLCWGDLVGNLKRKRLTFRVDLSSSEFKMAPTLLTRSGLEYNLTQTCGQNKYSFYTQTI